MVIPLLLSQNHEFCSLFAAQWQISAGPCVSCQRKKSAAIFLRWKFSTLLSANAAALCCICIILSHLDKNRCRTETSAVCISLPYNTLLQQRKCFETLKDFKWGMQKKETHCCPCSGLLWGLHYFCCTQHNLFPLLCWLNCFAWKVGDP